MDKVRPRDRTAEQLEVVLRDLLAGHERLLMLLKEKRLALRAANYPHLTRCLAAEHEQVQALGELEKKRLQLAANLTLELKPDAPRPMRLAELAELLVEPGRGRLQVLGEQLRQRMEAVRDETAVVRRATETLVNHMTGLVNTISGVLTGTSGYPRGARAGGTSMVISTINTTA